MNDHNARFVLQFPEMDVQHDYLYSLFDRIERETHVVDKAATRMLLDEIERYILFHCGCEEQLMRLYKDPGFSVHQSDHESMGNKLVQFLDDFEADRLNPAAMRIFLTGWLMEHSAMSDSAYVKWIREFRAATVKS